MERPVSFILGKNVRPKSDEGSKISGEELKRKIYAHQYSAVKPEDLPTSEIGDGSIFIEEL